MAIVVYTFSGFRHVQGRDTEKAPTRTIRVTTMVKFFYCSACLRLHEIAFLFRGFSFLFLYQSNSMLLTLFEMQRIRSCDIQRMYSLHVKWFFCAAQILRAMNVGLMQHLTKSFLN